MRQVLITGAEQGPQDRCVLGLALILDLDTGSILHRSEYRMPQEISTPEHKVQFTGSCFVEDEWYVCTHNEIVVYKEWPPRSPDRRISDPGFNDLHHCMEWKGGLAIANTGLETVDIVSLDGKLQERIDLLAAEEGARRIEDDVDYRLIPDTKPHVRHANHLFEMGGQLWTGQLRTLDAICARDPSQRLDLEVGMPHDGVVADEKVGFTTTNGFLVFFDTSPPYERQVYSLVEMTPGVNQLGWCRGIAKMPDMENHYLVGFSSLRRSKWKEFQYWFEQGHSMTRGHLGLYDLGRRQVVQNWPLVDKEAFQVFQVDILPEERWV